MKINDFEKAKKLMDDYLQTKKEIKALSANTIATDVSVFAFGNGGGTTKVMIANAKYSTEEENDAAGTEIRGSLIKLLTIRKRKIETKLKEIGVEIPGLDEINIKVKVDFGLDVGK